MGLGYDFDAIDVNTIQQGKEGFVEPPIQMDIEKGAITLHNITPNLAGVEITYSGNVYFNPTLPEGWIMRAGRKKILIVNFGENILVSGESVCSYEGKLNIKMGIGVTKALVRLPIGLINPTNLWVGPTFGGASMDLHTENWDTIENKNESIPTSNRRYGNVSSYSINKRGNRPIVSIPIKSNLHTEGGEYVLGKNNYIGWYHIHTDLNYAMTGKKHTKSSKLLSTIKDVEQIRSKTKSVVSTASKRTSGTPSGYGG